MAKRKPPTRQRFWLESWKDSRADSYVVVDGTTLKIADCNRAITLSFGLDSWEQRTKARAHKKIERLRWALDLIEQNLLNEEE